MSFLLDTSQIFAALQNTFNPPTDELVLCRKVEVTVQLQVLCPPLHPLMLDVCMKVKLNITVIHVLKSLT